MVKPKNNDRMEWYSENGWKMNSNKPNAFF